MGRKTDVTLCRYREPGWIELVCPDGRRGVWMRVTATSIELCAGREGDDVLLHLNLGLRVRKRHIAEAGAILETLAWAHDVALENAASAAKRKQAE